MKNNFGSFLFSREHKFFNKKLFFVVAAAMILSGGFFVAPAQATPPGLPLGFYGTGNAPNSVVAADFNNDTFSDFAETNYSDDDVSVFINDQNGIFASRVNYPVGEQPWSVVAADFNKDGKIDLATANFVGNNISVLMGNGDGTFVSAVDYPVLYAPDSIITADFNGDGYPDLAVTTYSSNQLYILLNNGDGTFTVSNIYDTGITPWYLATGDFDGDGHADLALINRSDGSFSIFLGAGDGTFGPPITSDLGEAGRGIFTYDFNGDGKDDLAIGSFNDGYISIYLSTGSGNFASPMAYSVGSGNQAIVGGDFNNDGFLDLATANWNDNDISVILGSGGGNFGDATNYSVTVDPAAITAADFDNDGQKDLVEVNQDSNTADVFFNTDGVFNIIGPAPIVYPITNCQDLQDIDSLINDNPDAAYADFEIVTSSPTIDCGAVNGTGIFAPISNSFYGTLNGNNIKITNFNISDDSDVSVGLFGDLESGATIENLTLSGGDVSSANGGNIGVLAGYAYGNVTIQNVTSTVSTLTGDDELAVGGLIGYYEDDDIGPGLILNNVKLSTNISAENNGQDVGGLIGDFELDGSSAATITGCNFSGNIDSVGSQITGGLIGYIGSVAQDAISIVNSSVSSDTLSGSGNTGGLIGSYYFEGDPKLTITKSYFSGGQVSGVFNVGGLLGSFENNSQDYSQIDIISQSYSTGQIFGSDFAVGGLIGELVDDEQCGTGTDCPGGLIISKSYYKGYNITGLNGYVGGLVGRMADGNFSIADSYSSGVIASAGDDTGGLVGDMQSYMPIMSIDRSYASGTVWGDDNYNGGLVGYLENDSTLTNSFSTSDANHGTNTVGGLVGYADNENNLVNDYWFDSQDNGTGDGLENSIAGHFVKADSAESFQNNSTTPPLNQWNFSDPNPIWLSQAADYPAFNPDYVSTTTVHTLNYSAGTGGSIAGGSGQYVFAGADGAAVTAVPNSGYEFVNWDDDSTDNPRTDTNVTDDISVTANFSFVQQITSCQDLQDIDSLINDNPDAAYGDFEIATDTIIDCSDVNGTGVFAPIMNQFYGTLNGNGVKITNFNISDDSYGNVGLFANLESGATIKNLSLSGDAISSGSGGNDGILAGYANGNITIENVTSTVSDLSADYAYEAGGLIGFYEDDGGSTLIISNVHLSTAISSIVNNDQDVGGLIGYIESSGDGEYSITDSDFSGSISAAGSESAGGLIGWVEGDGNDNFSIATSSASGEIEGGDDDGNAGTGGLIGYYNMEGDAALTISQSHYSGSQISDGDGDSYNDSVGGLLGIFDNESSDYSQPNIIDHSYSSGSINSFGDNNFVGGLIGQLYNSGNCGGDCSGSFAITDSYSSGDVTGDPNDSDGFVGGLVGAVGSNYINENFSVASSSVFGAVSGGYEVGGLVGFAYGSVSLQNITSSAPTVSGDNDSYGIGGLVGEYYNDDPGIGLSLDGVHVSSIISGDDSGNSPDVGGLVGYFYSDGGAENSISGGGFSGSISNNADGDSTGGVFGYLEADSNENISFSNVNVSGDILSGSADTGGLIGYYYFTGDPKLSILNSRFSGSEINGGTDLGGLLGFFENGSAAYSQIDVISQSYSTGAINSSGYNAGGLIGELQDDGYCGTACLGGLIISESYASGDVNAASDSAGGLVGGMLSGNFSLVNSYASGNVSGGNFVGGLVGNMAPNLPVMSVVRSYFSGSVTGDGSYVGGLVGYLEGSSVLSNSFNVGEVSNSDIDGGLVGNADNENNLTNDYWYNSLDNGIGNGAEDTSDGHFVKADSAESFQGNSANPPLDQWDFSSGNPIWSVQAGEYPAFNPDHTSSATAYLLQYSSGGNGTISGSANQFAISASDGTPVTAIPDDGYVFVNWSDNSTANPRTDTAVSGDISVTANFYFDPFQEITTCQELQDIDSQINDNMDAAFDYYQIATSSTLDCSTVNGTGIFAPINNTFYGTLDGNGAKIINLNFADDDSASVGIFSDLGDGAAVKNISLSGVSQSVNATYIGAIAGVATGNITIQNVTSTVSNLTGEEVGGLIGDYEYNTEESDSGAGFSMDNVHVSSDILVDGSDAGGLIGDFDSAGTVQHSITNSGFSGNFSGSNGSYVGGLIAVISSDYQDNFLIDNCSSTGDILAPSYQAGGLIGGFYTGDDSQLTISHSHFSGSEIDGAGPTGGILGYAENDSSNPTRISVISQSYSQGTINSTAGDAGGLIGEIVGSVNCGDSCISGFVISNSYSSADVNAVDSDLAGGLVGEMNGPNAAIMNSYASGNVTGGSYIGGLVGDMYQTLPVMSVNRSYFSGSVTGDGSFVGGLVGDLEGTSVLANSFNVGEISSSGIPGALAGSADDENNLINDYWFDSLANGVGNGAEDTSPGHFIKVDSADSFQNNDTNPPLDKWNFSGLNPNWVSADGLYPALNPDHNSNTSVYVLQYSAGSNGSITGAATQFVLSGTDGIAVTAVPDDGYRFVNWSDDSTDNPRTDTNVTQDISVTANFELNSVIQYTLTYTAGDNGSIDGDSPQTVDSGADGTPVTAAPADGYHFVNWSDDSTDNPRADLAVTHDISVTANFSANAVTQYTLTYSAGDNGSIDGDSPQTVDSGSNGTAVTAVPATGYHFVDWSDASTTNPRTDYNVTQDISVTANFAIDTYTLTYTAGANGSIDGDSPQTVAYGADGTAVIPTADDGYHFVNWSDNSTDNPRTDTGITGDISVTANFAADLAGQFTLAYAAGANGSLTGSSTQIVNSGADGTAVTAEPDSGYHFVNWSDNSTDNPRTDLAVGGDIFVTANFAANPATQYTLTYFAGAHGSITGSSTQIVAPSSNGTAVTAEPDSGYHFVDWSDASTTNPRTDYNIIQDISVTANFAANPVTQYTLTYSAGAHGTITGSSPQNVNSGSDGTAVTAVPNSGYRFVNWSDNSTVNPRTDRNVSGDISVTATFEIIPAQSGGGGGGSAPISIPACSAVVYGNWGSCVNGLQYRDILSQSSANCPLTPAQQAARSMVCGIVPTTPIVTSTIPTIPLAPIIPSPPPTILEVIANEAGIISAENLQNLLAYLGKTADPAGEQASLLKYQIILGLDKTLTDAGKMAVNDFIVYGTPATYRLGSGERAGVINSYFQAYGKLPSSESDWSDVIKIANGRWPSERNAAAEDQAKLEFRKVYGRYPVLSNTYDQNAVIVIAYGLIPSQRRLSSEAVAIKIFGLHYGHAPADALAWNVVRAIAYSGAIR